MGLQVANDLRDEFADGVFFISLANISDSDLVIPTIAGTLAIKETAAQPLLGLLKAALHNQHLLLVLDNFEQLQLATLFAASPRQDDHPGEGATRRTAPLDRTREEQ